VVALVLGLVLVSIGLVLFFDLAGAGRAVIRGVTSRSLGSLAPGYAASTGGFRVYAFLLGAVGAALLGLGLAAWLPLAGAVMVVAAAVAFAAGSVVAVRGEARTYRALQRKG
jgi:hypothetical protein